MVFKFNTQKLENQKKEYSELFEKYFLKSFSSRLAEYTNPEIDVNSKQILNEKNRQLNQFSNIYFPFLSIFVFA